VSEISIDLSLK